MKRQRKGRGANGTRDPGVTVTLDSGSHINARSQRPEGEHREPPGRCTAKLGALKEQARKNIHLASPTSTMRGNPPLLCPAVSPEKFYHTQVTLKKCNGQGSLAISASGIDIGTAGDQLLGYGVVTLEGCRV